jgi:hypothetical protein
MKPHILRATLRDAVDKLVLRDAHGARQVLDYLIEQVDGEIEEEEETRRLGRMTPAQRKKAEQAEAERLRGLAHDSGRQYRAAQNDATLARVAASRRRP